MKKHIIIRMLFMVCLAVASLTYSNSECSALGDQTAFTLSFDGSLYPLSPLHALRSGAMIIWGDLHDAALSSQLQSQFEAEIDRHAQELLNLYAQWDNFERNFKKESVVAVADEVRSLYKLAVDIERLFDLVMLDHRSDQASCFKVVLQKIQKKMERMLAL